MSSPETSQAPSSRGRILVADDDQLLRSQLLKVLAAEGYEVEGAAHGREAAELLLRGRFDAIVSDIMMPEMDGIQLLRAIRERDPEIPVVLMTGSPDVTTAVEAVRHGALLYLTKPFEIEDLERAVARAVRLRRIAHLKREALSLVSAGGFGIADRLGLETAFERVLESFWMAYQPILRARDGTLFGYEALLRSNEAALPHAGAVVEAAERLNRTAELGRAIRDAVVDPMARASDDALLFVNLHPRDLADENLFSPDAALSKIAHRVVLEITERASLGDVDGAREKVAALRGMGFRIAVDDLGAGYAGLTSFVTLEPDIAKLDMSLIRDIDKNGRQRKLVRSLIALCNDLGMTVVGEGVESRAERAALADCGCELLQGYLFAKPGRPFPDFVW